MEKYEDQIQSLRQELNRLEGKVEEEREVLAQRFSGEKEAIEEQLAQQLREELEVNIAAEYLSTAALRHAIFRLLWDKPTADNVFDIEQLNIYNNLIIFCLFYILINMFVNSHNLHKYY